MRYYVMESPENASLPTIPKGESAQVVMAHDLYKYYDIDYDARNELISDRFKLLLERFLLKYDFKPVVYLDRDKEEQLVFWRFMPPLYNDYQAVYRNDGLLYSIAFVNNDAPIVFSARSPKGVRSIAVRMAVAESALRRAILGVKFTKILELAEV
ncbi:MAG: hypothetical protein FWG61_09890 [Firmicutes bacterium]|nr:hypothetical protein [Bacillota bacterium]